MNKIKEWLKVLAKKAGAALPSILGAAAKFILDIIAKGIGVIAENLWMLVVAIVGVLLNWMLGLIKS